MKLPPVPNPPPPAVQRFVEGKPTTAQVTYEQAVLAWMRAVKAAVEQG